MLGSLVDADDAVQDTMLRALRALDRFDGRSSLGTWLYRIATNVCLDLLSSRERRMRPMEMGAVGSTTDTLVALPHSHWLEPVPDALAIPAEGDPHERLVLRESVRLAFVSALQHLPPRQRAVLILTQVLNWSAAEVAECLVMTTAAVNSALQRARTTLAEKQLTRQVERTSQYVPVELTPEQRRLIDRYVEAFEAYDVSALTMLLREDAIMSMPPFSLWLQGHESIGKWLSGPGKECRGSRLVPTAANGSPAFGQYRDGGATPWALVVLELEGDRIAALNSFLDTDTLFPRFGLPPRLPDATAG